MKRRIKLIIGSVMAAAVVSVFAANAMIPDSYKSDIKTILNGILSPGQIGDLIDFKNNCKQKYVFGVHQRTAPLEMWHFLDLTEDQQAQLLSIIDKRIDTIHPSAMQVSETVMQLKKAVSQGDADTDLIDDLAAELGKQMGVAAWDFAQLLGELKAVLTPPQQDLLTQHFSEHRYEVKAALSQLPDFSDDVAALWNDLRLSPRQFDALTVVHKLVRRSAMKDGKNYHETLKTEIEALLSPAQSSLVNEFLSTRVSEYRSRSQEIMSQREQLETDMDLTGEQKIELLNDLVDNRESITDAVYNIAETAFALHDAICATTPNQSTVTKAAAGLGDAMGKAALSAAPLVTAAREVLTPTQLAALDEFMDRHFDRHIENFRDLPAKVHDAVKFLHALALTPGQKEQIITLMADRHGTGHFGQDILNNSL